MNDEPASPLSPLIEVEIQTLLRQCGAAPNTLEEDLLTQLIQTTLRMIADSPDIGQLKLMMHTFKELRYSYTLFNRYRDKKFISIFGSARTPDEHPDYHLAKELTRKLDELGWMTITGAAQGIMKAGHEGSKPESNVGLSILLPFESSSNIFIEGDPKLIHFRYFFTRKLMFVSHSAAVAVFPGGFGTQDELFEILTLMQTGKTHIVPIVLLASPDCGYWKGWQTFIDEHMIKTGYISREDLNLYYIAPSVEAAIKHIQEFYKVYHSSRYVRDNLVIRINRPLTEEQLAFLNQKFSSIIKSGSIQQMPALPEEDDFLDLPRLVFEFDRRQAGILRSLIDTINQS